MVKFDGKIFLITGATGSIGEKLVSKLLVNYSPKVIRIYSRDETKQFNLAKKLVKYEDKLRFFIGDIRDKERLNRAMESVDIVIHLAALKHVSACEFNPFEAIKTNVIGTQNLIECSIEHDVELFVNISSDKAATPCNTMGVTKLLGEKLVTTANYYKGAHPTIFYSIRLGNVLGSRGSIIPLISSLIKNNKPITLTHRDMTRYVMHIDDVVNLIFSTISIAQGGEVFLSKMNAIKVFELIDVLIEILAPKYQKDVDKIEIKEIGVFSGEKLYEELFSIEEAERTYEMDHIYVIIPQLVDITRKIDLNKYPNIKQFDLNKPFISKDGPFLSKAELKEYLIKHNII